jgi:hypothetical protein
MPAPDSILGMVSEAIVLSGFSFSIRVGELVALRETRVN